ncbi:TetR/AcrR family transcriptional regulator [Pseudomonas sp. TUM22785]|uniref:TetR/AcrR family transcriptional regulator n=1 Tax=Pseudomonas sp. TUM22785 TaxID=3019098 RepID=UPI002306AFB8|nr:TetR/AcrR family transcriptional regulator [Pseudomonas sp. TUM22785]WCD78015.1 TetR/AcrR family transcriptional regulator [Pseudomonas sp. TUM22785]
MSKRPVIDRNLVLDAAISVVMDQGISALSIGEVAKAAGISKGGVQSCFGTKDGLVEAMVNRWKADYEASVMAQLAPDAGVLELLTAQIHIIAIPDEELSKRAAAILTAMFSQDSLRAQANDWYRSLLLGGAFESERGKRVRLAFLAATGAFFLRSFGIMEISEAEWKTFNEDIARLLPADASAP